jgi:putative transposase
LPITAHLPSNSWFSLHGFQDSPHPDTLFDFSSLHSHPSIQSSSTSLKTLKIRLYPTSRQKQTLRSWFGTARWTYNAALDLIKNNPHHPDRFNKSWLQQQCVNQIVFRNTPYAWVLDTPQAIRQAALQDLLTAYQSAFAQYQVRQHQGDATPFEIKYRTKKDPSQSIVINSRDIRVEGKSCRFFPTFLQGFLKTTQDIPSINHECRLQWLPKLNHFYLCIPMDFSLASKNQTPIVDSSIYQTTVAIDPGVITPATLYDPAGYYFKWGHQDITRIYRLCRHYDQLQSQWSQRDVRHKRRYRLKRAGARLQLKIRNQGCARL